MQHVAIDPEGNPQVCVRAEDGQILDERKIAKRGIEAYLKGQPPSRVVVETCAEAFFIADQALRLNHEVRVVPATRAPTLGVGARGIKTDRWSKNHDGSKSRAGTQNTATLYTLVETAELHRGAPATCSKLCSPRSFAMNSKPHHQSDSAQPIDRPTT